MRDHIYFYLKIACSHSHIKHVWCILTDQVITHKVSKWSRGHMRTCEAAESLYVVFFFCFFFIVMFSSPLAHRPSSTFYLWSWRDMWCHMLAERDNTLIKAEHQTRDLAKYWMGGKKSLQMCGQVNHSSFDVTQDVCMNAFNDKIWFHFCCFVSLATHCCLWYSCANCVNMKQKWLEHTKWCLTCPENTNTWHLLYKQINKNMTGFFNQ